MILMIGKSKKRIRNIIDTIGDTRVIDRVGTKKRPREQTLKINRVYLKLKFAIKWINLVLVE